MLATMWKQTHLCEQLSQILASANPLGNISLGLELEELEITVQ